MKQQKLDFKIELIRRFGSQCAAAIEFGIDESRLSHIINWHPPRAHEFEKIAKVIGKKLAKELLFK